MGRGAEMLGLASENAWQLAVSARVLAHHQPGGSGCSPPHSFAAQATTHASKRTFQFMLSTLSAGGHRGTHRHPTPRAFCGQPHTDWRGCDEAGADGDKPAVRRISQRRFARANQGRTEHTNNKPQQQRAFSGDFGWKRSPNGALQNRTRTTFVAQQKAPHRGAFVSFVL